MWFWWFILICDLLVPTTMFVGGLVMTRRSPKSINSLLGYRTARSMKNMNTWQFAHRYCGSLWWKVGLASFVITILVHLPFRCSSEDAIGILSLVVMAFQIITLIVPIFFTEKALQKNFDGNGNRK